MKDSFKKDDVQYKDFVQDLGFFIVKITRSFHLWKVSNLNILFYICVLEWYSLLKDKFIKKYFLTY
jgi:hypothetical protein